MNLLSRLLLVLAAMSFSPASATPPQLGRSRLEREHAFSVARSLAEAFVFFEPIGEKLWAENWQPVFVAAEDAELRVGSVFLVPAISPAGREIAAVWAVAHYEPPHRIEYRNVLPGVRATWIVVQCAADGPHRTRVTVRYTYHAISDEGDAFVRKMTVEKFAAMIESWGEAIAAYLARGTPASP